MDSILNDNEFRIILKHFNRPWSGYRKVRKGVKKRIRRHMRVNGVSDVYEYLELLSRDQGTRKGCEECLCVTISRFFRDSHLWSYLGGELLPLVAREYPGGVRTWVIGCGCGEEVYSLSLIWHQLLTGMDFTILATDINPQNLTRAQKGCYQLSSMKEIPQSLRADCFQKQKKTTYCIDSRYKTNITWKQHDLFSPLRSDPFHMIFLRNSLLTYHHGEQCSRALEQIIALMVPGGHLVVGSHEKVPEKFAALSRNQVCPHIYTLR